jgi:hypothetical protein
MVLQWGFADPACSGSSGWMTVLAMLIARMRELEQGQKGEVVWKFGAVEKKDVNSQQFV